MLLNARVFPPTSPQDKASEGNPRLLISIAFPPISFITVYLYPDLRSFMQSSDKPILTQSIFSVLGSRGNNKPLHSTIATMLCGQGSEHRARVSVTHCTARNAVHTSDALIGTYHSSKLHQQAHTQTHTRTHTYTRARAHTHTHTHTYTRAHTHTHTGTHECTRRRVDVNFYQKCLK